MKTFKSIVIIAGLFLLGAVIGACGGGGDAPASSGDANTPVSFDIEGQDIAFDINTLTVKSGQEVTINLDNVGTLEHSWVLVSEAVDALVATEADAIAGISSGTVAGGEAVSFTFIAPAPGTYQYVCTIEGHAAAGMVGELIVE